MCLESLRKLKQSLQQYRLGKQVQKKCVPSAICLPKGRREFWKIKILRFFLRACTQIYCIIKTFTLLPNEPYVTWKENSASNGVIHTENLGMWRIRQQMIDMLHEETHTWTGASFLLPKSKVSMEELAFDTSKMM